MVSRRLAATAVQCHVYVVSWYGTKLDAVHTGWVLFSMIAILCSDITYVCRWVLILLVGTADGLPSSAVLMTPVGHLSCQSPLTEVAPRPHAKRQSSRIKHRLYTNQYTSPRHVVAVAFIPQLASFVLLGQECGEERRPPMHPCCVSTPVGSGSV